MKYENEDFLKFVRTKGCVICGSKPAIAHHVRDKSNTPKELWGGTGLKPGDYAALSMCPKHHKMLHDGMFTLKEILDIKSMIIMNLVEYAESKR